MLRSFISCIPGRWAAVFLLAGAACFPPSLSALSQNKLTTKTFDWKLSSTRRFDVYRYGTAGERLFPFAARYLEKACDRTDAVLPAGPGERPAFFLYNTHNDFEESNIAPVGEGTAGVTEAFKNRALAGHTGSQRSLEYVTAHEYVHAAEYGRLFSGPWRSARLLKFIIYPHWLMEGLAEYVSGDLDRTAGEMYVRDAATSGTLLPLEHINCFTHLQPGRVPLAYKESEALMRYIADEYGPEKLRLLIESYRDRFYPDTVLRDVLGTGFFTLDRKFREYLEETYARRARGLSEPSAYGERLTAGGAYPRYYESAVFSPDGRRIAYLSNEEGLRGIRVMALSSRGSALLWQVGRSLFPGPESAHAEGNALAFSPDGSRLAFGGERRQKDYLYLCDLSTGRLREIDTRTDTVSSPAFSPDGETVYFSGIRDGFRDLFAFSLKGGTCAPLTAGPMDEIDAAPSPDGRFLVFSAERANPSGRTEYDLCRLELAGGRREFLTSLAGDERSPFFSEDGSRIYFTSDRDGVRDIYSLETAGGRIERLTRVIGGNFQPRVRGGQLLFSSFRRGERHLYLARLETLPAGALAPEASVPPQDAAGEDPPGPRGAAAPARPAPFRASTDLFIPALYYSTLDGLSIAGFWQASDLTGDHQLQAYGRGAAAGGFLEYNVSYGFLRLRPQFFAQASGRKYFVDADRTLLRREDRQGLTVLYPLNRFQSVSLLLFTADRREKSSGARAAAGRARENTAGLLFQHDTEAGPYLEPVSGRRVRLSGEWAEKVFSGDTRYQRYSLESEDLFPLGKEHTLAFRAALDGSFGPDAAPFLLGGERRVRGLPAVEEFAGKKALLGSIEWRFPLAHDINYHLWYVFPDIFFKSLYGTVFVDAGAAWNDEPELARLTADRWKGSGGAGLRCRTYLFQALPVLLQLQAAVRADDPSPALYFSVESGF